jgi:very-short-patch-repair endonuclease
MRRQPTEAEEAMDSLLEDMGLDAWESQVSLDAVKGIVIDFLVRISGVGTFAIEVDGPTHRKGPDARRDRRLQLHHGITTIRVKNQDILEDREGVRAKLMEAFRWES